jgi:methylenetetrahydrofolate dehydrogenase (NADP+)/methenyltetrahydrofolate cyclohydrolase
MAILDGRKVSREIEQQIKQRAARLKEKTGLAPGLSIVIVGDNLASDIYVKAKDRVAGSLGVKSSVIKLPREVSTAGVVEKIKALNHDDGVDAISVQLPLPDHLNSWDILDHVAPDKDVDRYHPLNMGMVHLNRTDIFPCTPAGILEILDYYGITIAGTNAVVIGKSFIMGKPMASILSNKDATVTLCHEKTGDLERVLRDADLVVSTIGKPGFVTPGMVKEGVVLVDVGINYLTREEDVLMYCEEDQVRKFQDKGYAVAGDIHKDAFKKASYYTPVPGGVGPMTVTMMIFNALRLFEQRRNIDG